MLRADSAPFSKPKPSVQPFLGVGPRSPEFRGNRSCITYAEMGWAITIWWEQMISMLKMGLALHIRPHLSKNKPHTVLVGFVCLN